MEEKEARIRAITRLYYSNPKIQEYLAEFAKDREVVPRYFEGFGKRPDTIQYSSDISGLVKKGATSFHASEEIWNNPLEINSEMNEEEMNGIRKAWDLLIDIDSPFLDYSKVALKLITSALERHGIKGYGIKFSGSKGFHIIVPSRAFPEEYGGRKTKDMFPEWPRAISQYLMEYIRKDYNKEIGNLIGDMRDVEKRTNLTKEQLEEVYCENCSRPAKKRVKTVFKCPVCGMLSEKKDFRITKRRLKCLDSKCPGVLEAGEEKEYNYCENCKDFENEKFPLNSEKHPEYFKKVEGVSAEKIANLDLVLVAPRHLFRMPYSLHEKTALASVVIDKEEIDKFSPNDANPMKVNLKKFIPDSEIGEGKRLLAEALDRHVAKVSEEEREEKKKYFDKEIEIGDVTEEMFPKAIKKLLLGLEDGRKRGLFVLLTFLRSLKFSEEYINKRIREWNKSNKPPLKEGYIKSQIEWHVRQRKKILPPNYSNDAFYRDLGILDEKPKEKNPIVEVIRRAGVKKPETKKNIFK